jgi:hypothetical protein
VNSQPDNLRYFVIRIKDEYILKMQHVSHDDMKQNILQNANALKENSAPCLFYIRRIWKLCGTFQATNDPPEFCKPHSLLQMPRGSDTRPVSSFK